jgi:putative alpha-1,2-mannosidase
MDKGFISDPDVANPVVETKGKAGVTKTLEYSYDDYAVALLAKELKDEPNYSMLMKRSQNYKNMFDPSTGLMRGRLENGDWVKNFNPQYPITNTCTAKLTPGNRPFLPPTTLPD